MLNVLCQNTIFSPNLTPQSVNVSHLLPKNKKRAVNSHGQHNCMCVQVCRVEVGCYDRQRSHNSRQPGQDQAVSWTIHFKSSLYYGEAFTLLLHNRLLTLHNNDTSKSRLWEIRHNTIIK